MVISMPWVRICRYLWLEDIIIFPVSNLCYRTSPPHTCVSHKNAFSYQSSHEFATRSLTWGEEGCQEEAASLLHWLYCLVLVSHPSTILYTTTIRLIRNLYSYEIFPEWIMPVLIGVSVVCLAKRDSQLITNLFGGSNGNEGLGLFSVSFDWQYIANPSPLWYPLQTLFNNFIGYVLCVAVFVGVYYGNIWNAMKFPFLSQNLYTDQSNGTSFTK